MSNISTLGAVTSIGGPARSTRNSVSEKIPFTDADIEAFIQSNLNTPETIAKQAEAMSLSLVEMQHALDLGGITATLSTVQAYASKFGYDAKVSPESIAPSNSSSGLDRSGIWSPVESRRISPSEVQSFLSTNPSDRQILQKAAELGLTQQDLNTALKGQGYTEQALGQVYNRLSNNLWTGGLGYSAQDTDGHGAFDGRIVAGNGHYEGGPDGKSWVYGHASPISFGSIGIMGPDNNSTNNWTIKSGYIGNGVGTAGDHFAGTSTELQGGLVNFKA